MYKHPLLKTIRFASGFVLVSPIYAQAPASGAPQTAAESPDAAFVQRAGGGGLAEVKLSKLAVSSTTSPQVREFARKVVQAHSENNQQLATIAAHENLAVPKDLDSEPAPLRDKLAGRHGPDFDRTYIDAMRGDHQKMVDLLQSSQASVSTEELRAFIQNTLPVVQDHQRMANELTAR